MGIMILLLETIPPRFEPQSPGKFWITGPLIVLNSDGIGVLS